MLRVNRLAAAIDMMAAGTRAPIPIAANATPTNQDGKLCSRRAGTAKLALKVAKPWANSGSVSTPTAIAMKPSSARRPSMSE